MRGANPGRGAELWIKSCGECGKASRAAAASALLVAAAYLSLKTPPRHSSALYFFFSFFRLSVRTLKTLICWWVKKKKTDQMDLSVE